MEFTVENICGLLIRSRLLTPEEVKAVYQRWLGEAKETAPGVPQFMRWLVANNVLTDYQANLISKGHADGFFLNQYKILDRVGRGRMAGVYKGIHQLGQVVAIKVLPPSRSKDPQLMGRFQREARLALKLKHPHVVRSFQVGETNGLHYLVMEYLEGETLEEVLHRRKKLGVNEAVRIIYQALLGLQHIHEQGFVHRDLKPANLMLVPAPAASQPDTTLHATVKILDIGLARALFEESNQDGVKSSDLTSEGVLLGTPDYLAPEQARDPRHIDIRADIYSLGCVLYHTLTGQAPFPDTNLLNQMVRHATEMPRPVRDFNPHVPEGLQHILNWMLAKQPDQRYPTPGRAAQALQMFLVADIAPQQTTEEADHLRQYLTWLETDRPKGDAPANPPSPPPATPHPPAEAAAPASAPPPAAPQPVPPPAAATKSTNPPAKGIPAPAPAAKKPKQRKPAGEGVVLKAQPAPPPSPAPAPPAFDVELLPYTPPPPIPRRLEDITRRDWLFLGLGVGLLLVLELLLLLLAALFKPAQPSDEE